MCFCGVCADNVGSRSVIMVKQHCSWLVQGLLTAWQHTVLLALNLWAGKTESGWQIGTAWTVVHQTPVWPKFPAHIQTDPHSLLCDGHRVHHPSSFIAKVKERVELHLRDRLYGDLYLSCSLGSPHTQTCFFSSGFSCVLNHVEAGRALDNPCGIRHSILKARD